jgi:hypothetical protein
MEKLDQDTTQKKQIPELDTLFNTLKSDFSKLDSMMENNKFPEVFGLHVYASSNQFVQETLMEEFIPDTFGSQVIEALIDLIIKFREKDPTYNCTILIAGGHEYMSDGQTYASLYRVGLERALLRRNIPNLYGSINIKQQHKYNTVKGDLASDTRGEIRFFKTVKQELGISTPIALIGTAPHMPRIQDLADNNGLPAFTLSAEGIECYIENPVQDEEYIKSKLSDPKITKTTESMGSSEKKKRLLGKVDRKGILLEAAAKILGEWKQRYVSRDLGD